MESWKVKKKKKDSYQSKWDQQRPQEGWAVWSGEIETQWLLWEKLLGEPMSYKLI